MKLRLPYIYIYMKGRHQVCSGAKNGLRQKRLLYKVYKNRGELNVEKGQDKIKDRIMRERESDGVITSTHTHAPFSPLLSHHHHHFHPQARKTGQYSLSTTFPSSPVLKHHTQCSFVQGNLKETFNGNHFNSLCISLVI